MSFDLSVWYSSRPLTVAEADERYSTFCGDGGNGSNGGNGGGSARATLDERLTRFVDDLTSRFPQIDDVADDEIEECPWNCAFDVCPTHVRIPIMWSRAEEVVSFVLELAGRHGLVCYDPQSRKVHLPPGLTGE